MSIDPTTKKTINELEAITGVKLTLGKLIWAIRTSDNFSQVAFAQTLGISRQQLCDIEHDRKSISPKLAARYAKKLGYSKAHFVKLALQESLDREGLGLEVDVHPFPKANYAT